MNQESSSNRQELIDTAANRLTEITKISGAERNGLPTLAAGTIDAAELVVSSNEIAIRAVELENRGAQGLAQAYREQIRRNVTSFFDQYNINSGIGRRIHQLLPVCAEILDENEGDIDILVQAAVQASRSY